MPAGQKRSSKLGTSMGRVGTWEITAESDLRWSVTGSGGGSESRRPAFRPDDPWLQQQAWPAVPPDEGLVTGRASKWRLNSGKGWLPFSLSLPCWGRACSPWPAATD